MYVKVTRGGSMGGDFIMEVEGPITSGSAVIPFDPAKDNNIVGALGRVLGHEMFVTRHELELGDEDFKAAQRQQDSDRDYPLMSWTQAHVLAIEKHSYGEAPAENVGNYWQGEETDMGNLIVKYAWWHLPDIGTVCIITTRNIFILGDNGKTIDRVR
jgi:hypothetical protein